MVNAIEKRCFFLLTLIFVACPFAVLPNAGNPYRVKTAFFIMGISLLFVIASFGLQRGLVSSARRSPLGLPIIMFSVIVAASAVFAGNHYLAAKEVLLLLSFSALFFASAAFLRGPRQIRYLMAASALAAIGTSAVAILQYVNALPYWYIPWGSRVAGLFDNPNSLGGYIVWNLVFAIVFTITAERGRTRLLWGAGGVLMTVCLMMSSSRSSWFSAAVALSALFVIILTTQQKRARELVKVFSFLLIVGIAFTVYTHIYEPRGSSIAQRIKSYAVFMGDEKKPRTIMWRSGIRMAIDNPLLGAGIGNLKTNLPTYSREFLDPDGKDNDVIYVPHVYNDYIQIAAEAGLPGIASFLIVILVLFNTAVKGLKRSSPLSGEEKLIAGGLAAAAAGILTRAGAFQSIVHSPMEWFPLAVFACGISSLVAPLSLDGGKKAESRRWLRPVLPFASVFFLFFAAYMYIPPEVSDTLYLKSHGANSRGQVSQATHFARLAHEMTPRSEEMLFYYAYMLSLDGKTDEALKFYLRAEKLQPNYVPLLLYIGDIYFQKKEYNKALPYYKKVLWLVPNQKNALSRTARCYASLEKCAEAVPLYVKLVGFHPEEYEHRFYLGFCYRKVAQPQKAYRALKSALEIRPGSQPARYNLAATLSMLGRREEATDILLDIVGGDPHFADAYAPLSYISFQNGDIAGAEKHLRNYLRGKGHSLDAILRERGHVGVTADNFPDIHRAALYE